MAIPRRCLASHGGPQKYVPTNTPHMPMRQLDLLLGHAKLHDEKRTAVLGQWDEIVVSVCTHVEGKHMSQPGRNCHWWDWHAHSASLATSTLG